MSFTTAIQCPRNDQLSGLLDNRIPVRAVRQNHHLGIHRIQPARPRTYPLEKESGYASPHIEHSVCQSARAQRASLPRYKEAGRSEGEGGVLYRLVHASRVSLGPLDPFAAVSRQARAGAWRL